MAFDLFKLDKLCYLFYKANITLIYCSECSFCAYSTAYNAAANHIQ